MFPLNSNMPYIKDTGERDKLGNVLGGSSEIPAHTAADAGKVLTVNDSGSLEWGTVSGSSRYIATFNQSYEYPDHSVAPFVEGGN